MKPKGIHIRPMTHDDLPVVFKLGEELLGTSEPWDADSLSDILIDGLEYSIVAGRRKEIFGFAIAGIDSEGEWFIYRSTVNRYCDKDVLQMMEKKSKDLFSTTETQE